MNKNLRWKSSLIVVVVALSIWAFYPPGEKINLGLDLKGGVHLVLRVQTDDALKLETETTVERLRDTLTRAGVQFTQAGGDERAPSSWSRASPTTRRSGTAAVEPDAVFNRGSGGGPLHLHDEAEHRQPAARRGGDAGAADDRAARQRAGRGRADRGAPGRAWTRSSCSCRASSDVQRAKDIIRSTALLELKFVEQGPFPSRGATRARPTTTRCRPTC